MLGDTINISKDASTYDKLLSEGMLPAAAIRRIETDKRLGIGIKVDNETNWDINVVKIVIIGLGLFVGYSIIKKIVSPINQMQSPSYLPFSSLSIDNMEGIDLNALYICRQNGLM